MTPLVCKRCKGPADANGKCLTVAPDIPEDDIKDGYACHRCGGDSEINDEPNGLGPPVCLKCYDENYTYTGDDDSAYPTVTLEELRDNPLEVMKRVERKGTHAILDSSGVSRLLISVFGDKD